MFGLYRTLLALIVVVHHLLEIPVIGHYAVHGFFILSGYLMTYVMHNSYKYEVKGVMRFISNRFLRLFPAYWFVFLISVLLVMYFGEENSVKYRQFIFLPSSFSEFFQNVFLIYIDWKPSNVLPRLSPPTWALTVELLFYVLIALGVSKNKKRTFVWLTLGVLYTLVTYVLRLDYSYRYSIIFAGSLPFSMGAIIYHYKEELIRFVQGYQKILNFNMLFLLFALNSFIALLAIKCNLSLVKELTIYINYFINSFIIIFLIEGKPPVISKKVDKIIGDFSYPTYLFHWQAGFAVSMILWNEPIINRGLVGVLNVFGAIVFCFIISLVVILFIDKPIERIRKKIRENR